MLQDIVHFIGDLPPLLHVLLIVSGSLLFSLVVYLLTRNNPNTWQNRLKRYDGYENRIKFLEKRVELLEQERSSGTPQKSTVRSLKDS